MTIQTIHNMQQAREIHIQHQEILLVQLDLVSFLYRKY